MIKKISTSLGLSAIQPQLTIEFLVKISANWPLLAEKRVGWKLSACALLLNFWTEVTKVLFSKSSWLALFLAVKIMSGLECDPKFLSSLIGKSISVLDISGKRHFGRLLAIDPVSLR